MIQDSVFFWDRTPSPEDVEAVAQFSPQTAHQSHLVLWWESGTPVDPVQRWTLYEATPLAYVPAWKMDAFLSDPPCRCVTQWSGRERCYDCGGLNSPGRYRIFEYLHRTETLALPFWVIQGHEGGHKHRFNQAEQQWQKLMRQPENPPEPGSLCYAPLDQRVIRRVRQYDRTRRAWVHLATAFAEEKLAATRAFHAALASYVDRSVEAAFDAVPLRTKGSLVDELPQDHTQDRRVIDLEAERDRFITQE